MPSRKLPSRFTVKSETGIEISKIKKRERSASVTVTGRRWEIKAEIASPRKLNDTPVLPEIKLNSQSK